jgi:Dyp-type peroxidase family
MATRPPPPLRLPDPDDLQLFLRHGFPYYDRAAYCLFEIGANVAAFKTWLGLLHQPIAQGLTSDVPTLTSARLGRPLIDFVGCGIAIAFTPSGLRALGLDNEAMGTFVPEFQQGMAVEHRLRFLGDDVGDNVPANWHARWRQPIDGVLMVFANQDRQPDAHDQNIPPRQMPSLDEWLVRIEGMPGCPPLARRIIGRQDFARETQVSTEPFRFADGVSQPIVQGLNDDGAPPGIRRIRTGEFVLGYLNEIDRYPVSPSVAPDADPSRVLPRLQDNRGDLGRNGTFIVIRQLEQHVDAFDDFVANANVPPPQNRELLAAQMVGRWRSGAALVLHDQQDGYTQRVLEAENDFGYHREDRHGFTCPIGAHIRRANPRDSLAEGLGITPEKAQLLVDQHRILRRGRVYEDGGRQGLVFVCLNANIERQFEFIQNSWLLNGEFGGLTGETDPLIGVRQHHLTIQHPLLGQCHRNLPQFVSTRGGEYFFLPSITALNYLARLP